MKNFENSLSFAQGLDAQDPLHSFREKFHMPQGDPSLDSQLYFCGHSLGPMPKKVRDYIEQELVDWQKLAVEGHFHAKWPWLPYHEFLTPSMARLVGAKDSEVVVMNTLTVNLHLMLVSFYRPTEKKYKILIEQNTFPSDKYAVDSQAKFHGHNPEDAIIILPTEDKMSSSTDSILQTIEDNKDELALVMLGNCNYLSGQRFDFEKIVQAGHRHGIPVGFNLAHGAGNLKLNLHDWNVDFAVWCSYKYLNSGPGSLSGCFVHENHHKTDLPRFEGWWGTNKKTRFKMGPQFEAIESAEAWQLSNPPIFQLAALRASMEVFDDAGMDAISEKSKKITSYMEFLIKETCSESCEVITPEERGSMLCLRFKNNPQNLLEVFKEKNVICDFREPDILRMTPAPLYNTYEEVYRFVEIIAQVTGGNS
jgi:kynureninase